LKITSTRFTKFEAVQSKVERAVVTPVVSNVAMVVYTTSRG